MNSLTKQQREKLFNDNINLVYYIYHKKYRFVGEDGVQMGFEGLWTACLNWNEDNTKTKFSTYACNYIDGYIKNGINSYKSNVEVAIKKEIANRSGCISEKELWEIIKKEFSTIDETSFHILYVASIFGYDDVDNYNDKVYSFNTEDYVEMKDEIQNIINFVSSLNISNSQKYIYFDYINNMLKVGSANITNICEKYNVTKQWVSFVVLKINKMIKKRNCLN